MTAQPRLTSAQRAAVVLLGLDEDVAQQVLKALDPRDLRVLAAAADSLGNIGGDALPPAFEEFEKAFATPRLPGGPGDYLRKLTASTVGADRARALFAPPEAPTAPLETIRGARAQSLAELLVDEHPQVAAVILSQLPRQQAAEVLLAMTPEQQSDLLARVASLEEVPADMVALASEALAKALAGAGAVGPTTRDSFDGIRFAADLLNELGATESERLLGAIEHGDGKLAPKIREAMFTFEDLGRIEPRQLQPFMREVPSETLLVALKTASDVLRERFLSAISSRAAETMREDLAAMPPTRLSDVEKAQREIVEVALKMAAEGRLVLPGGSNEEMV